MAAEATIDRAGRRRYALASVCGAVPAVALLTWFLAVGGTDLFDRTVFGAFYDAQTKALLHGHWNVPPNEVFLEGFRIGSKTYTYFGIWPSVLRMPVLAFGDGYYGRLTQVSMLLAIVVALVGVATLGWRIRSLIRPDRGVGRGDLVVAAAVTFVFGCGTTIPFLTSRAWVYNEAILWGVAWALVAYERIIAFVVAPRTSRLVAACTFATLAFLSRPAAGLGPVVALALVGGGQILRWLRETWRTRKGEDARGPRLLARLDWLGTNDDGSGRRWVVPTIVAVVVPAVIYGWMNYSRFGTLFQVPWNKQALVGLDPDHARALAANGGTYFGLKFAPTTALQYLRPDALSFDRLFPFVSFPRFETPVIGDALFDTLDWSTSVPASMPALTLLGALGLWAVIRSSFARTRSVTVLRVPVISAAVGVAMVIGISFVANRYLGDWLPLLALTGLLGLQVLLRRREEPEARRSSTVLLGVVAGLAVFGLWVNPSLALVYQRLYNPADSASRVGMLGFQYDLDAQFGGRPRQAVFVPSLPSRPAAAGTTAIVGDCASMYWSDGRVWRPIEGGPAGGWFRFAMRPGAAAADAWQPIVSWGSGARNDVVGIRRFEDGFHVGLGRSDAALGRTWLDGRIPIAATPEPFELDLHVDQARRLVSATQGGRLVASFGNVRDLAQGRFTVGQAVPPDVAERFAGRLTPLPPAREVCESIATRRDD